MLNNITDKITEQKPMRLLKNCLSCLTCWVNIKQGFPLAQICTANISLTPCCKTSLSVGENSGCVFKKILGGKLPQKSIAQKVILSFFFRNEIFLYCLVNSFRVSRNMPKVHDVLYLTCFKWFCVWVKTKNYERKNLICTVQYSK